MHPESEINKLNQEVLTALHPAEERKIRAFQNDAKDENENKVKIFDSFVEKCLSNMSIDG